MQVTVEKNDNGEHAVYDYLRNSIRKGLIKPGERLLSPRDLGLKFSASYRNTVRTLKRLEREGLIDRRRGVGTYVREDIEPVNLEFSGKTLKVVVDEMDAHDPFIRPLVNSLKSHLVDMECGHSFINMPFQKAASVFEKEQADAFIWVCPSRLSLEAPLPKVPLVLVAHDIETVWPEDTGYDIVTVDARQSGAVAGRYLRELGCRRVVLVGAVYRDQMSPYTFLRRKGFEVGYGQPLPDANVFLAAGHTQWAGAGMLPQILELKSLPEAIFCDTDDLAYGLCHALVAHGIRPGTDVKVIGCDGQPPQHPEDPALTTVAAPMEALGRSAALAGIQRARNPEALGQRLLLMCSLRNGATA